MQPFTVTLKNYRCFDDVNPLRVDIEPGFTALVGPNNSGKSSLLKFFYEFRLVFSGLVNADNLNRIARNSDIGVSYLGIDDPYEIFYNRNTHPLFLEIEFPKATDFQITSVRLYADRTRPNDYRGELFCHKNLRLTQQV